MSGVETTEEWPKPIPKTKTLSMDFSQTQAPNPSTFPLLSVHLGFNFKIYMVVYHDILRAETEEKEAGDEKEVTEKKPEEVEPPLFRVQDLGVEGFRV